MALCRNGRLPAKACHQGTKNHQAVSGAERRFHGAFGMRHQAQNVAFAVANAGDGMQRAVGIGFAVVFGRLRAIRLYVVKNNSTVAFEFGERGRLAEIISFVVRNRNFQHLTLLRGASEGSVGGFDADVHLATEIAQALVAHHRAGKKSCFEQDLEAVADSEDQASGTREAVHGFHYRRKSRNRPGAQVIAIREAAGENYDVAVGKIFGLVPDEFDGLMDDCGDGMVGVFIAIRAGKLHHSEFHRGTLLHLILTYGAGWRGRLLRTAWPAPNKVILKTRKGVLQTSPRWWRRLRDASVARRIWLRYAGKSRDWRRTGKALFEWLDEAQEADYY